ncbi:hypothetical protein OIU78_012753 [Salix suchowensis]|nr:hypothetical protein OIU78_012753 [Salix suchowensis]
MKETTTSSSAPSRKVSLPLYQPVRLYPLATLRFKQDRLQQTAKRAWRMSTQSSSGSEHKATDCLQRTAHTQANVTNALDPEVVVNDSKNIYGGYYVGGGGGGAVEVVFMGRGGGGGGGGGGSWYKWVVCGLKEKGRARRRTNNHPVYRRMSFLVNPTFCHS